MKLVKTILFLSATISSSTYPINPKLMYLFKDSWKKNITIFEKDYYSYHDKQDRTELEKFAKSYDDLAHAVFFLEITTMSVSWQNALLEAKKYLNATAQYYELVAWVLRDPTILYRYEFQLPQSTMPLSPCHYMQLNAVKEHIYTVNALLKILI